MTTPIRIVLDTTAIGAYAAGSIAVGELISEVADENAHAALPIACLADAYRRASDDQLPTIGLLAAHTAVVVVDTDPDEWQALAGLARDLARVDTATALLLAVDCDGYVVTAEPGAYGDPGKLPIIAI